VLSGAKPRNGYFLRAESFFNVAEFVDSGARFAPDLSLYGDAGLLIAGGPAASTAFAGWRAAPTAPAPGQLPAAKASCPAGGPSPGGKVGPPRAVPPGPPALSDVRGPYSMLLYISGDGGASLCMSDGSFVRILPAPAPSAPAPAADGLVIDHLAVPPQDGSGAVTFVEGRVGCDRCGAHARRRHAGDGDRRRRALHRLVAGQRGRRDEHRDHGGREPERTGRGRH
jgi:hypothetical protein